jgi:membrane protein implicated in regulation of membrane protease activity
LYNYTSTDTLKNKVLWEGLFFPLHVLYIYIMFLVLCFGDFFVCADIVCLCTCMRFLCILFGFLLFVWFCPILVFVSVIVSYILLFLIPYFSSERDRQTDRQAGRQTDRDIDRETKTQKIGVVREVERI